MPNKIIYKKGDLISAFLDQENPVNIIAHQCNCFCNFGKGIAPQIKKRIPEAYHEDMKTVKGDKSKLGTLSLANTENGIVFNLYGQYGYWSKKDGGINTEYSALQSAFKQMANLLLYGLYEKDCKKVIGLPKLGCGLGGGDWNVVSKIIEEELCDKGFTVYVYEL